MAYIAVTFLVVALIGIFSYVTIRNLEAYIVELEKRFLNEHELLMSFIDELSFENQTLQKENHEIKIALKDSNSLLRRYEERIEELKKEVVKYQEKREVKVSSSVSRSSSATDWQTFTATYYDNDFQSTGKTPDHPAYGITASGRPTKEGVSIAVDPTVIPLGTWVEIKYPDGRIEQRRADDTGGAIKGHKIDIYIPQATLTSGKHPVQVRIIEKE